MTGDNNPKKKRNNMNDSSSRLSLPEKAHIEELLKSALQEYAHNQTKNIKDRENTAQKITAIITEYLGPFILLGYDSKGEPFNIIHATSQLDADAISAAVNKFIFNSLNNQ